MYFRLLGNFLIYSSILAGPTGAGSRHYNGVQWYHLPALWREGVMAWRVHVTWRKVYQNIFVQACVVSSVSAKLWLLSLSVCIISSSYILLAFWSCFFISTSSICMYMYMYVGMVQNLTLMHNRTKNEVMIVFCDIVLWIMCRCTVYLLYSCRRSVVNVFIVHDHGWGTWFLCLQQNVMSYFTEGVEIPRICNILHIIIILYAIRYLSYLSRR